MASLTCPREGTPRRGPPREEYGLEAEGLQHAVAVVQRGVYRVSPLLAIAWEPVYTVGMGSNLAPTYSFLTFSLSKLPKLLIL